MSHLPATCPTCGNLPEWPELSKDGMTYCKDQFHKAAEARSAEIPPTSEATLAERIGQLNHSGGHHVILTTDHEIEALVKSESQRAVEAFAEGLKYSISPPEPQPLASETELEAVGIRNRNGMRAVFQEKINAALEDYRNVK